MKSKRRQICAPLALFVYKRPYHTQRTVEALRNNLLAKKTDLFIFADGPKNEAERAAVGEVRKYIRSVRGFKAVKVFVRKTNVGLAQSIIEGVTRVLKTHARVIVVEDDLVTAKYFLKYMNDALELYESEDNVISIHGYCYPIRAHMPETFFLQGADCWGWGTWRRGWDLFETDAAKLLEELRSKKLEYEFDLNGSYHYTQMLREQCEGKVDSWAIRWHASAFLKNKYTLYPGRSLVHNIGHDSSGSHSETMSAFDVRLSESPILVKRLPVEQHQTALRHVAQYWRSLEPSAGQKLMRRIRNLLTGSPT